MKAPLQHGLADADDNIPLKSREVFKFYEPIILLRALNSEMRSAARYISPAEDCDTMDPKQLFKALINKLAMVCDSAKGGRTVTSIWVSEDKPGPVEYHIASNQRSRTELEAMTSFVTMILEQVRGAISEDQATDRLLPPILKFNRLRINLYLDRLREETQRCLDKCSYLDSEMADIVAPELQTLLDLCPLGQAKKLPEPDFIRSCKAIIQCLIKFDRCPAGTYINHLGRDARESAHTDCWSELRHMARRLTAYLQFVAFVFRAKATFPQLFSSFVVSPLSSSRPLSKPIVRNKSLTADSIVGRLTRRDADIETFRVFVRELQLYELDERIRTEFTRDTFRPIVHSEVLQLNSLEFGGGINPARFFGGWMYIGSSKPACRLCSYYFAEHGSGVEYRTSHGNLYSNWRLPDVRADQGLKALQRRATMLERMLKRVRGDAFELVRRRAVPTHRNHDSVTSSARVTLETRWLTTSQEDDLGSMLGTMSLEDDDSDDSESGGVQLRLRSSRAGVYSKCIIRDN